MKRLALLTTLLLTLLSSLTMMTQWQPAQAKVLESSVTMPRYGTTMELVANVQVKPNTPPTATITISPTNPLDDDNLTLSYLYFDVDGDNEQPDKVQLFWLLDNQLQPAYTSAIIPFEATNPQETWCATVRVYDGKEYGPIAPSACVTIGTGQNHAPQVLSTTLMVQRYLTNTVLQVTGIYSDVDLPCFYCGKKVETLPLETVAQFQWFRNDVLQPEFNNQTVITRSVTVTGEAWLVTLQVFDGIDTSGIVRTFPVMIGDPITHTLPKAENVHIVPIDPTTGRIQHGDPVDSDNLSVRYDFVDAEGDDEQGSMIYWYNPLTRVTRYDGQVVIPASETQVGQSWYVQVIPCDGLDCGAKVDSDSVQIKPNRTIQTSPGALIIVAGRLKTNDPLRSNIHNVTNEAYKLFRANGYSPTQIYYMATDLTLDADNDGISDVITMPTKINLEYAITQWAKDKLSSNYPLTLYFIGYELNDDQFYLDGVNQQVFSPDDLHGWLNQLEDFVPGLKVNIIIDTAYAGSFISAPGTVSKPGRVVMASTSDSGVAYASQSGGAVFSDAFLAALKQGHHLYDAFQQAKTVAELLHRNQTAWLDSDGNGIANELTDVTGTNEGFLFAMPDGYEPDNGCNNAKEISTTGTIQTHHFYNGGLTDTDWVKFQVISGTVYTVTATGLGPQAEPMLTILTDCNIPPSDFGTLKLLVHKANKTGSVYLRVENHLANYDVTQTAYTLTVMGPPKSKIYLPLVIKPTGFSSFRRD